MSFVKSRDESRVENYYSGPVESQVRMIPLHGGCGIEEMIPAPSRLVVHIFVTARRLVVGPHLIPPLYLSQLSLQPIFHGPQN